MLAGLLTVQGSLQRVARNPELSSATVEWLASHVLMDRSDGGVDPVFVSLARHVNAPEGVLRGIYDIAAKLHEWDDDRTSVHLNLARNERTPVDLLIGLLGSEYMDATAAVLKHPATPSEVVTAVRAIGDLASSIVALDVQASEPPDASPEILTIMGGPSGPEVLRVFAAAHAATPLGTLERLAEGRSERILFALAGNRSASPELLDRLAREQDLRANTRVPRDGRVLTVLAGNPACSGELLRRLAESSVYVVRAAVAANPSCPKATIEALLSDRDLDVAEAAAANPALKAADVGRLWRSHRHLGTSHRRLGTRLAAHPHHSIKTLDEIAANGTTAERASVAMNARLAASTIGILADADDPLLRALLLEQPALGGMLTGVLLGEIALQAPMRRPMSIG